MYELNILIITRCASREFYAAFHTAEGLFAKILTISRRNAKRECQKTNGAFLLRRSLESYVEGIDVQESQKFAARIPLAPRQQKQCIGPPLD